MNIRFLSCKHSIQDSYSNLLAIRANLWDVHRVSENRERVKGAWAFSTHFITQLPNSLGKMIDEQRDFAVAQFLIDPARAAGKVIC